MRARRAAENTTGQLFTVLKEMLPQEKLAEWVKNAYTDLSVFEPSLLEKRFYAAASAF